MCERETERDRERQGDRQRQRDKGVSLELDNKLLTVVLLGRETADEENLTFCCIHCHCVNFPTMNIFTFEK